MLLQTEIEKLRSDNDSIAEDLEDAVFGAPCQHLFVVFNAVLTGGLWQLREKENLEDRVEELRVRVEEEERARAEEEEILEACRSELAVIMEEKQSLSAKAARAERLLEQATQRLEVALHPRLFLLFFHFPHTLAGGCNIVWCGSG